FPRRAHTASVATINTAGRTWVSESRRVRSTKHGRPQLTDLVAIVLHFHDLCCSLMHDASEERAPPLSLPMIRPLWMGSSSRCASRVRDRHVWLALASFFVPAFITPSCGDWSPSFAPSG